MTEEDITRRINFHCSLENGFLIQLSIYNSFDSDKYKDLLSAIREYTIILGRSDVMSRRIAGDLFFLQQRMDNTLSKYIKEDLPNKNFIDSIHNELWEAISDVWDEGLDFSDISE